MDILPGLLTQQVALNKTRLMGNKKTYLQKPSFLPVFKEIQTK